MQREFHFNQPQKRQTNRKLKTSSLKRNLPTNLNPNRPKIKIAQANLQS